MRMTHFRIAALAAFGTMAVGLSDACCVAYGMHRVSLIDEKALIIWDSAKSRQHFIRQASFKGEGKDFGFIVPTPAVPEVKTADAAVFDSLGNYVMEQKQAKRAALRFPGSVDSAAPASAAVTVIDEFQVGDYHAAIVKATDGGAMLEWLKKNGYQSRPAMEEWLDHYAKKEWVFTALKFIRKEGDTSPKTSAIRVSFDTKTPFYPYKMPTDTWPERHVRPMELYVISDAEMGATYETSQTKWEGLNEFSGPMNKFIQGKTVELAGLKPEDMPANAKLTYYLNRTNKNGYGQDLHFTAKPSSSMLPIAAGLGGGTAILLGVLAVTRRKRIAPPG